jgi:hypothetical protein
MGVSCTIGFDWNKDGTTETEAVFEQAGFADPVSGFSGCNGADTGADASWDVLLGNYFIRPPLETPFGQLIIEFSSPVLVVTGEIWDIDGGTTNETEQYELNAYDADGYIVDTETSPSGDDPSGCSAPWDSKDWGFALTNPLGVVRVTIEFTGGKTGGIGVGFNNIDACLPVPTESETWGAIKSLYQ